MSKFSPQLNSRQNLLSLAPIGETTGQEALKPMAVIVMNEVTEFVHDHVLDTMDGHLHEFDVEGDSARWRTTSPAPPHYAQGQHGLVNPMT